ncbi:MAG TPA: hypothetical protein VHF22_14865 [Planctomycetota bacterium]|nr:hypothetical protein [Planctomycetota bacterium]
MAKLIENAAEVTGYLKAKQLNEVALADDLLAVFGGKPAIDELRTFAGLGLSELITLNESTRDMTAMINKAMTDVMVAENKNNMKLLTDLAGLKHAKPIELPAALPEVLAHVKELDASQCSDLIRLYVGIAEGLEKRLDKDGHFKAVMTGLEKDENYRSWAASPAGKEFLALAESSFKDRGQAATAVETKLKEWSGLVKTRDRMKVGGKDVWNKDLALAFGRHRVNQKKLDATGHLVDKASMGEVEAWLAETRKGGATVWKILDTSTIGLIDRVFGLVAAADISGTTVDSTFFMTKMIEGSALCSHDPIFWMLPLATIVAANHHSTVEVAIPLTQMGKLDYACGFYTTLMPKGAKLCAGPVQAVLQKHEKDPRNRHMLVFYAGKGKVAGCWVMEEKDLAAYRKLAAAGTLLKRFQGLMGKLKVKGWPAKEEIRALLDELKIAAS